MKLKSFIIAAASMAFMASCSSDAVVEDNSASNAIAFSVTTAKASRANTYWCNNNLPEQFNVWAKVDATPSGYNTYFANESYSKEGDVWTIDGGVRYWPDENTSVIFFAAKHYDAFIWDTNASDTYMEFTPQANATNQVDLIYAKQTASRPTTGNQVAINFRHALSQIVFKAENLNENLYVQIDRIDVCKAFTNGHYNFYTNQSTSANIEDHDQGAEDPKATYELGGRGQWVTAGIGTATATYTTDFAKIDVAYGAGVVNLTDNATESSYGESLLLIPQESEKYNPADGKAENQAGSYFLVWAQIRNIADTENGVAENDVYLWGDKDKTKAIAVPVAFNWDEGKKYIYTIRFTQRGNGGYDPEDGDDVLIPIEFDITVDDFAAVTNENVDLEY